MPAEAKTRHTYFRRGLVPFQAWITPEIKRRILMTAADRGLTLNEAVSHCLDRHLPNFASTHSIRKGNSNGSSR